MDTDALLATIGASRLFPYQALAEAETDRDAFAAAAIADIDAYVADPGSCRHPDAIVITFHLLASWGRKEAYPSVMRLLAMDPDDVDRAIGDSITETSHRVMAALYDGDPQPVFDLILDNQRDAFVRSRLTEGLAILTMRGDLDRAQMLSFLERCFEVFAEEPDDFIWNGWTDAVARTPFPELVSKAEEAFDKFIDPMTGDMDWFRRDFDRARNGSSWLEDDDYLPFGGIVEELAHWHGFSQKHWDDVDRNERRLSLPLEQRLADLSEEWSEPASNPYRNVGRNDPCPCGSGKKFKACHLK